MKKLLVFSLISLIIISCSNSSEYPDDRVRIAIPDDVTTFNPMYSFSVTEGAVSELLYLPLVKHEWNETAKSIVPVKYLASDYQWVNKTTLKIVMRTNVYWSDSQPLAFQDVTFSLISYSDPAANTKFYGFFDNYYTDEEGKIIGDKTFEVVNDSTLIIKFREDSNPNLLDIDFPLIPEHIFGNIPPEELMKAPQNQKPVTSGAYKLKSWVNNSSLLLEPVTDHFLNSDNEAVSIEFLVISDYQARLLKLKQGEVDFIQDILPEDVAEVNSYDFAHTEVIKGRDYDYIGWNNIDPKAINEGSIKPNKFFGDKKVREALSLAINRKQILEDYLKGNGLLSNGPVTPIVFDSYIEDADLYNPDRSKELLAEAGWKDNDNDGLLDKNGEKFSFDLNVVSQSKRKAYIAEIVKANLSKVGIEVNIKNMEYNNYVDNLMGKQFDSWVGGWYIPLPIELKVYWGSDFKQAHLNFAGYQSLATDNLLNELYTHSLFSPPKHILQEIQEAVYKDHPFTFLFWVDQVFGVNNRVSGVDINPLGAIHSCWEWRLN